MCYVKILMKLINIWGLLLAETWILDEVNWISKSDYKSKTIVSIP